MLGVPEADVQYGHFGLPLELLLRINQLRFTIANVRVGGAEEVKEAVERLVGTLGVRHAAVSQKLTKKVLAVAGIIFAVFTAGGDIQPSIEAWDEMSKPLIEMAQHVAGEAIEDDDEKAEQDQPQPSAEAKPSPADRR